MKVLVVDDEQELVSELCAYLRRRGHVAFGADGVEAARAILRDVRSLDVVLTDMRMPDGSGVEVVRACRRLPVKPVILIITGDAQPSAIDTALAEGASRVFSKPLSLRALGEALAVIQPAHATQLAA